MIIAMNPGESREQYLERVKSMAKILGQPGAPPGWDELMKEVEKEVEKEKKQDVDS